ncbi:hypothetical protein Bbelb_356380 [Branchiostoma belcheri]|nr:hypothetical protein Bbelb_356380 [Branchiostoma belcheri]
MMINTKRLSWLTKVHRGVGHLPPSHPVSSQRAPRLLPGDTVFMAITCPKTERPWCLTCSKASMLLVTDRYRHTRDTTCVTKITQHRPFVSAEKRAPLSRCSGDAQKLRKDCLTRRERPTRRRPERICADVNTSCRCVRTTRGDSRAKDAAVHMEESHQNSTCLPGSGVVTKTCLVRQDRK